MAKTTDDNLRNQLRAARRSARSMAIASDVASKIDPKALRIGIDALSAPGAPQTLPRVIDRPQPVRVERIERPAEPHGRWYWLALIVEVAVAVTAYLWPTG